MQVNVSAAPGSVKSALAARGAVDAAVLARLLVHPYFARPAPKSLDRDDFDAVPVAGLTPADGAACGEPLPGAAQRLARVQAWNEVVLNQAVPCTRCGAELPRGRRAYLGLGDDATAPRAWLCAQAVGSAAIFCETFTPKRDAIVVMNLAIAGAPSSANPFFAMYS